MGSKDPILESSEVKSSLFNILDDDEKTIEEVKGFPRFITTKGGAYCFFPGINALKYITEK